MAGHWCWNNVGVVAGARAVSHHVSQRSFAGIKKEDVDLPSPCSTLQSHTMGWEESLAMILGQQECCKDMLEETSSRNFCLQPGRKDVKVSTKS